MTKVVHVTTSHPVLDSRIYYKECCSLRDAGYEVVLIAAHERDELIDGIRIRSLPQASNRFDRAWRLARLAYQYCLDEQADIYHFHDPMLLPWLARLARKGRLVIYDMHESVVRDILTKPYILAPLRPLVAATSWLALKWWLSSQTVIFAEQSYQRDYPWIKRSVAVQNLPRLDKLAVIEAEKQIPPAVGYLGSVTALRGSLRMLEALAILQREGQDLGLEWVGYATPEHQAELERHVERLGLKHVRFHGRLEPQDAWQVMAGCIAGLAVLADIPNYRESYPTKLFEYMALGLPVVVSDFLLYRSVIDNAQCGFCVDPADPQAIAEALRQLSESPAMAEEMGERGRAAVLEQYRWETEEHKLLALYHELLTEHG
jgi:glycosyltransferase involved in cell wall biosynthesis